MPSCLEESLLSSNLQVLELTGLEVACKGVLLVLPTYALNYQASIAPLDKYSSIEP
jgi:hypothetical protein